MIRFSFSRPEGSGQKPYRNPRACAKCGGDTEDRKGVADDCHFPNLTYRMCLSCGAETTVRPRKSKPKL